MQPVTVIIKMDDTRIPMLMYKHTSTGRKTQLDQGIDGEKKHPENGKKSLEWFVYTPCCCDGGGNLMPCSLIRICVGRRPMKMRRLHSRNVGNLIHV